MATTNGVITRHQIDEEIRKIHARMHGLQIADSFLRRLRDRADGVKQKNDESLPDLSAWRFEDLVAQPTISDTLRRLVKENPGISIRDASTEASFVAASSARDPRRSAYNLALQMASRGQIRKDNENRLWPPESEGSAP